MRNEEEASNPDLDQSPLQQEEPTAEALGPEISSCLACDRLDAWDDMIMCDGLHEERWYHLRCVGIKGLPPSGTKNLIGFKHGIYTDYALGDWLCPDCRLEVDEEEYSSDGNASDYGNVPKKRPSRRSAPRPKKAAAAAPTAPAASAPRPIQDRRVTLAAPARRPIQNRRVTPAPRPIQNRRATPAENGINEEYSSDEYAGSYGTRRSFRRVAPSSTAAAEVFTTPASRSASFKNSILPQDIAARRLPGSEQPEATVKPKKQDKSWTAHERDLVRALMQEVLAEGQVNLTEKKWEVISDRLASRYGFRRSNTSIKNYWNRQGRAQTGVDERRKPNPTKLTTSVQTAQQRKRARKQVSTASRRTSSEDYEDDSSSDHPDEDGEGNKEEKEATDDDEGGPPSKRRRCR